MRYRCIQYCYTYIMKVEINVFAPIYMFSFKVNLHTAKS